ncbi:MAG: hypothetical protein SGJ18_06495 [Pseudomonadota bacterium]|nr:hypothetical protein [Pseudomonadota bacterium]
MPDWNVLGSLMTELHQEFVRIYYLMLPVFFALSVAVTWFRHPQGSIEFIDVLKRAVISTLLLVAFPEITKAIVFVADGIVERIDAINSLDNFMRMAQEKSQSYSFTPTSILLQFDDLIIAALAFLSYLVLYIARFLTIAMYHFYWIFYTVIAPLLLLFNMFSSTSQITKNLFKGMIEVASWKIVWAVLGAMLTALSFSKIYQIEGNYITLIAMNFIITIAMLMTPKIVSAIVGHGFHAEATSLGAVATAAAVAAPARAMMVKALGSEVVRNTSSFSKSAINKFKGNK